MQSITLRFLAASSTFTPTGRIPGGTVLRWVDEAGFACATAWAKCACVTERVGAAHFMRSIRPGDLVEVQARLAYTRTTSMGIAVEVYRGALPGSPMQQVLRCATVYVAVDGADHPRPVDAWNPQTPGDMALAEQVRAHIDAARAA